MKNTFEDKKNSKSSDINQYGELPLAGSPEICIDDSKEKGLIPQQYLTFYRTKSIVESILKDINFSDNYLLFVDSLQERNQETIYIQVGIIGQENYPPSLEKRDPKIVYGRRWLIEEDMPTSEIIQTAMLAIQKGREHELREYFTLVMPKNSEHKGKRCTPFNSHLDLPLMAENNQYLMSDIKKTKICSNDIESNIKSLLNRVSVAGFVFNIKKLEVRESFSNQQVLLDLEVIENKRAAHISSHFEELKNQQFSLLLNQWSDSDVLFELMDYVINLSKKFVEEKFKFKNFNRFSRRLDIQKIGELSCRTRLINQQKFSKEFQDSFKEMTFYVDSNKVPSFNDGDLGSCQKRKISLFKNLKGFHPNQ